MREYKYTSNFFEKNLDKVKWDWLCMNTNIPVEFFEKHLRDVNWFWLCANKNIPVEFFQGSQKVNQF